MYIYIYPHINQELLGSKPGIHYSPKGLDLGEEKKVVFVSPGKIFSRMEEAQSGRYLDKIDDYAYFFLIF